MGRGGNIQSVDFPYLPPTLSPLLLQPQRTKGQKGKFSFFLTWDFHLFLPSDILLLVPGPQMPQFLRALDSHWIILLPFLVLQLAEERSQDFLASITMCANSNISSCMYLYNLVGYISPENLDNTDIIKNAPHIRAEMLNSNKYHGEKRERGRQEQII